MKKLPYGISDYERLIENNYYYIDKTMYIETLENLAEPYVMFLRPRKFGKTLFTSTLENYYDINKKDKFEKLYGETYIGKNPTLLRNSYHILRFNFSGIDTETEETTMKGFKREIASSIEVFTKKYNIEFFVNIEDEAENILDNLIKAFGYQKPEQKIYVIIDEYDHFANELLSFNTNKFKELASKNGKVKKWYEVLKKGTETAVDRIFITGVAPIILDSLTSGFNICSDKTRDRRLNNMLGFTEEELVVLMIEQNLNNEEQNNVLPILKENYNGYKFCIQAEQRMYNSNMCLYFLNEYVSFKEIPSRLIDMNIASDYSKLGRMLDLSRGERRLAILEKTISGEGVVTDITEKFNPEVEFGEKEFTSMLFYLGYLTIKEEELGFPKLIIPNKVMKEIYSEFFLKVIGDGTNVDINDNYAEIVREIALQGKIDKILEIEHKYLNNLSNRDFVKFDEKYVKLIFYCIAMNLKLFRTKSELEVNRNYPDLLIVPLDNTKGYKSVMIEFKYLKKDEKNKLKEKQEEAREQIKRYSKSEEIKDIENLNKYTVVVVNDEIFQEKVD